MKMKKFINNPENLTPELLEGFAEAHKELVTLGENRMIDLVHRPPPVMFFFFYHSTQAGLCHVF